MEIFYNTKLLLFNKEQLEILAITTLLNGIVLYPDAYHVIIYRFYRQTIFSI